MVVYRFFTSFFERLHAIRRQAVLPSLKGVLSTLLVGLVVDAEEGFLEVIGHGKCWDRLLYNLQRLFALRASGCRVASG
uniref:Uncharacterized protein n=1 Tax=Klebsiella pneumoniae TaxID=573 RepID=A0A8B0STJ6_KLEPN|nr:hypothetical protein [Klebsiella pneumoniae]